MAGRLTTQISEEISLRHFTRAVDPWFFQEVEKMTRKHGQRYMIACPITDYLFRWDRGAFWGGKFAFRYFLTPFNRVTRFMLDPFLDAQTMFRALHLSGLAKETIIQDIGVPVCALEDFMTFLDDTLRCEYYWLCPIARWHRSNTLTFGPRSDEDRTQMWINVGIWGPGPKDEADFVEVNRIVERKTNELGVSRLFTPELITLRRNFGQSTTKKGTTVFAASMPQPFFQLCLTRLAENSARTHRIAIDWSRKSCRDVLYQELRV